MTSNWMIYGAYGDMGVLIVEQALQRKQRPVLAGRNAAKIRTMAEKYGLEWRAFEISQAQQHLTGISLVLNIAGPFSTTSELLVKACLDAKVHYLDIANELPSFQMMKSYDVQARQAGIALIPGVGFGVITTDMLSSYVAQKLRNTVALHIAMLAVNARSSGAATRTTFDIIRRGGWVRRDGKLIPARLGSHSRKVRFPEGERTLILAPLGDLETSYWSTHVPNITTYIETAAQTAPFMGIIMPLLRQLLRVPAIRHRLEGSGASQSGTADKVIPAAMVKHSYVWVSAADAAGKQVQAWLQMGEGLAFTAAASVLAVEQTLKDGPCGALSPAMAFGVDFVLNIPGVTRLDTV